MSCDFLKILFPLSSHATIDCRCVNQEPIILVLCDQFRSTEIWFHDIRDIFVQMWVGAYPGGVT